MMTQAEVPAYFFLLNLEPLQNLSRFMRKLYSTLAVIKYAYVNAENAIPFIRN